MSNPDTTPNQLHSRPDPVRDSDRGRSHVIDFDTPRCPNCGKHRDNIPVQGHYPSCDRPSCNCAIGPSYGCPAHDPHGGPACSCGDPDDRDRRHNHNGSPCLSFFRVDV